MTARTRSLGAPWIVAALVVGACRRDESGASAAATTQLSIAAASSLKELLETTQPTFEKAHAGTTLAFSFEASSTLSRQIEAGGAFDAFLSADAANVERIAALVDPATRRDFLSNQLAVVVRAGLGESVKTPDDLATLKGPLALAAEAVPAGKYARAFLKKRGLIGGPHGLDGHIVNADNVRATLALVETGTTDAAIVYATDARVAKSAQLAFAVSADDDPGIVYVAATLKNRRSPIAADYVSWLASEEFQSAAAALGFVRVDRGQ